MDEMIRKVCCTKEIDDEFNPFIINHLLSSHIGLIEQTEMMNKYTFHIDKDILQHLFLITIPRFTISPFLKWYKKPDEIEREYQFLIDKMKKMYMWSEKEIKHYLPILTLIFQNKENLKQLFQFYGIELSYYKKYGIEFENKKRGLQQWLT